jgi:hypothetical protein
MAAITHDRRNTLSKTMPITINPTSTNCNACGAFFGGLRDLLELKTYNVRPPRKTAKKDR